MSDFYKKEQLEKAQARVRETATPAQLRVMDAVSAAIEAESRHLDEQFTAESKLRVWAKDLCGVALDMSEIEDLRDLCRARKPGLFYYEAKRGRSVQLVKTVFGTVDRADNYLVMLEKTVIDITSNSQFTSLPPFDLMKLALKRFFKQLFRRKK